MEELRTGFDIHADNQARMKLPERRLAKVFVFKLIYGGTSHGFANQAEFAHVSTSREFWDTLISTFYSKYRGIHKWYDDLVTRAIEAGGITSPTGRRFDYPPRDVVDRLWYWRPKILNYIVQGTGADIVSIGRVTAWKRFRQRNLPCLWQSTVHDSIDLDVLDNSPDLCYNICKVLNDSINDIPKNFYRLFGVEWDVPIGAEISFGPSLGDLTPWQQK